MAGRKANNSTMVNTMNVLTRNLAHSALLTVLVLSGGNQAYAAPGTLSTAPLFVSTAVEPNIFLTLDDSGSMDWEMMYPDGTAGFVSDSGIPQVGRFFRYYWNPDPYNDRSVMPPATFVHPDPLVTWDDDMWVMRNHNANKLYYNPETNYTPWPGVDALGNQLYIDNLATAALITHPNQATVDNLTRQYDFFDYDSPGCNGGCRLVDALYIPSYYVWSDTNADPALAGNGIIDASDGHTLIEIKTGNAPFPTGRSYAEEIRNFANWYQYYRKREFASKAAIGGVINTTNTARMGLDIFNLGHQTNVTSMSSPANKLALLNTFYNIPSDGITPARTALQRVGELFKQSTATAPILNAAGGGECKQNFNIVMTDGFWNGPNPANIDNADGDGDTVFDGGTYADQFDNTLADVAMNYYEDDLRTDLINNVPTQPGVDEADHQHLVTYAVAFGLNGTLDATIDNPRDAGFSWPDPIANNQGERIDDLWHAAYNGRGQYLSAQNPDELQSALGVAIDDIAERTATASAASVTSARLTTESVVFVSEFNTNRWEGTILAFKFADLDLGLLSETPVWNASDELSSRNLSTDNRVILTYDNTAAPGSVKDGIPFQWANLTADMKADLRINAAGGIDADTTAEARLDYLRGDRSNEGEGLFFRERASLLGDIVHSGPVYVAQPSLRWPDGDGPQGQFPDFPEGAAAYSEYQALKKDRAGVIYVGANDGMIHGFAEGTGKEVLAYIPSNLFSVDSGKGLHYLSQQTYIHLYYNDLTPTVSDVYINNGTSTTWRTVMIAGQGAGGRGYAALDVTDPTYSEANAAETVMWEFTSDDDPDLGYTFSIPQVGMTNDGEWVAIFGNGYNHTGDGQAKLFIVKIEKGLDGTWTAGDYTEITTGVGTVANPNGLATPALADTDGNGTIDLAYAGDLEGNLWKFDLSATATGSWNLGNNQNKPLFTAIGNRPITSKPALSFHPTQTSTPSNSPNILVTFGTGQFIVEADKSSTHKNYFYGVWDEGVFGLNSTKLIEQTYRSGFSERVLTQNTVDYKFFNGWYISLPDSGERTVTNSIIRNGIVFFNTAIPSSDACSVGGFGFRFAVDLETGGTPNNPIIDRDDDGKVDDNDTIGLLRDVASAEKYNRLLTDDTITENHIINQRQLRAIQIAPTRQVGRISWQELLQW
jgi:type IV pilus assembly protein PilY1